MYHSNIFLDPSLRLMGLPWWFSDKESVCQCSRCEFDPWVRKIPWRKKWQLTSVFLPENPVDRGAWRATVPGVQKNQIWLSDYSNNHLLLLRCFSRVRLIDGSPPGSPVPGILQARTLEWVAISFSNAWKWKVKVKSLSRAQLSATPWTGAY